MTLEQEHALMWTILQRIACKDRHKYNLSYQEIDQLHKSVAKSALYAMKHEEPILDVDKFTDQDFDCDAEDIEAIRKFII
jgi:hypothetical protein